MRTAGRLPVGGQALADRQLADRPGGHRGIPVPAWLWDLWDMVKDLPDGPLTPSNGDRKYQQYGTVYERFMNATEKAGIPAGFTPHSLRHGFASAMLSKGVPIADVAHWPGPAGLSHRDRERKVHRA